MPACEDCDDAAGGVFPGATETCNRVDDDCDGEVDEAAADATAWYRDADGDSFTLEADVVVACTQPALYSPLSGEDCDDEDASVYPGAAEVRGDGIDQDCDGADAELDDVEVEGEDVTIVDTGGAGSEAAAGCQSGATAPGALAAAGIVLALRAARRRGA